MKQLFVLLSIWLAMVSCCPDGNFNCTNGECLPARNVCDFQKNCKDGSDEEFCGSCDFEDHTCGWKDVSDAAYKWSWVMVNITSRPGQDHTTGSPWGHVMYVNGKDGDIFFDHAHLEYSVNHTLGLGCQISFWYHIYDPKPSSISLSTLEVTMVRGHSEKPLLEISKRETSGWENATVFIGNQPGGYKLLFSYNPAFLETKDVMLDDISFEFCGEEDIPDGSDQLSCDFEKDTCSWYHDYTTSLLWKRSNGYYDHLTGNGYFMLIKAANNLNPSSTARLISFPQPAGQTICVSFFYYIFGNSIGSLKFIEKRSGEAETVVWMRSGTQGNKWRFADLTFNSDKPIQFIIEAVVGGKQGSIAIDDLVVFTGSCPPERECTFQGSLCGLQPQASSDFTWNRITGASQPANSSGPSKDHTLGTEYGYYLSAELWRHSSGSRGAIMTAVMDPTPSDGECLMFWYYMEGGGVGELSVYIQNAESHETTKLWTRRGDEGTYWRHGRATLYSPGTRYQVIFEAIAGDGPRRDVSIDDLTVLNGACPPAGFCDFELDFCGWVNSPPQGSGVDWDWLSGESEGQLVPRRDHTTDSSLGHFAFFRPYNSNREEVARLESEFMEAVDQACLRIWHHAVGWSINRPSAFTLTVFVNETGNLQPLFNTSGYTNGSWIQDSVDYKASGQHQIILQVWRPATGEGSFSLDDIHVMRGVSCDENILTTTTTNPPTTTTAPDTTMDCTFEEGLCNWTQEESDDTNWTLSNGLQVKGLWNGPLYDHTVGNNRGFFLLLNGSGSKDDEKAVVSVPVVNRGSQSCVEFWYYILGPSVSTLNLLIQTKSSELLVWTRQGSQNSEWMNAKVTINISDTFKIMITGYKNTYSRGFMAVDDVTVREGVCSNQNFCGFDSSSCGFENGVDHKGRWERKRATISLVDHTYGTENGFFMAVMNLSSTQEEVAELFSPKFTSAAEMCARFWYWLPVDSSNILSVHVMRAGMLGDALWQRSGSPTSGWEVSEVTVSSPADFYVVFRAVHVPGTSDTIKIDDFSVSEGACNPPATCDFESGQCNWVNVMNEDGHDWVLAHGGPNSPPTDHTTQTSDGWFLLSSALHQSQPSVAQVVSEWIHLRDVSSCLTFWYHTHNSDSGTLKVFLRSDPSEEALIFHSSSSNSSWSRYSQSLEISKPFQLLITAESNNQGFIAIDDFSLIPGSCPANKPSIGFVGCSFENGTCDWEDVSVGQFQWMRRNATGNSGPSVDNTLGTELGWYVAVEADRGEEMSPAALQSPIMQQASSTCTLHFYYNMYGEAFADSELRVLLKVGSRSTPLLWLSGNHGDTWHHSEVMVGRSPQEFTILFEASRDFNNLGHVALDDISFTNCSLPDPESWCPESMFKCNNKVCVDPNQVCDFSDDCGDGSDELSCEKQGVMERCSFEQGFCSWANSDLNPPGADWRLFRGHEASSSHGPRRDHTRNSDAGHYVTPGLHLTERKQTSEILSKTLLPSINCTVRFFYFSMDDAAATLTVQSKTQMSAINNKVLWVRGTSQSYSWQRAKVTFSTSARSKIVFRYELGGAPRGLAALDDVSFSKECVFDPENGELPDTTSTSAPPTPSNTPTTPINPCQDNEFFCHHSAGNVCVPAKLQCDYHADCPRGEDEAGCGPCTFESDQCRWTDVSDGQSRWHRQKASNNTDPPTDHTTETGFYMRVNLSLESAQKEAKLLSPPLPPSSPYCQILFHFHIDAQRTGSLRVLMQQAEGGEAILWSCSHNTVSHWASEHLPVGRHQQPYKLWFSSIIKTTQEVDVGRNHVVAVDDISFLNCEQSYQPPDLPSFSCTFEDGLCVWVQGAEEELDWLSGSGPTETPNTGPAGDHTTGKGKYLYIESSHPSTKGNMAHLKSPLLPPAGDEGYCFTFWYHMFGATVGSLRMLLKSADSFEKTLVWQKSGDQGDEWLLAQSHVTLKSVHQVVLEATVGGEAGDIAIDDVAFLHGPCPASDLCDFEDSSCNWQQVPSDDLDWIRQSGYSTGPETDHTTSTAMGHYYYLPSSTTDLNGQTASMFSPLYPASKGSCVMLWYYMHGEKVGTLNVYQQSEDGKKVLIFSQLGDQGRLWRFAQASLLPRVQPYKIVVEGVKAGPALEGGMAFDDVQLTDAHCPPHGFCDFESALCSWSNLGGGVDQGDWLRGAGDSPNPNTGPTVDHTTNSTHGHYVYVDSSVGEWGDVSFLISDVFQPSSRGHCLTFWYHMYGGHIGTLRVYINDRKMHAGGKEEGLLKWIEQGNKGDQWLQASVPIKHKDAFWFVFAYQRGMSTGGDIALDDIKITSDSCYPPSPILPSDNSNSSSVGLAVGLTLLAGVIISIFLYVLNWKCKSINQPTWMDNEGTDPQSGLDMFNCTTTGTEHDSDFSFYNKLYDPSTPPENTTEASSDA